jgi:hypothetical protein
MFHFMAIHKIPRDQYVNKADRLYLHNMLDDKYNKMYEADIVAKYGVHDLAYDTHIMD